MHCELIILVIITICWNKNQVFSTILEPKAVIESFLDEEVEKEVEPRKSNQFWAERILAHLNALYPWHRFLVFVNSEVAPDVMWHVDYGFYIDHIGKRHMVVYVYVSFATDVYKGRNDCYGNMTDLFQSCAPATDVVVRLIGDECGKHDRWENVAIRAVVRDPENRNDTLGVAWSVPDRAVRHELIGCQGHRAGNKRWHIVVALHQPLSEVAVKFMHTLAKEHPVANFTLPLLGLDEPGKLEQSWPIFVAALLGLNFALFTIILMAAFLLYKLRNNIRQKGTFGIYLKAAWFFVPHGAEKELDNTLVDIEHLLYTGPNSRVYFARYRFTERDYRNAVVKVPSRDAFQLCHIEAEMRINAQLRHPRVVEYIGFYRDAFGDVRIVSEYMAGGDLHTFLASSKNTITVGHIFNFIVQIAEGMEYLISRQLIHRDLAARNCMLDHDYTQLKIADFGLSRQFNADATYASTSPVKLPLRWMPPECFDADGEMLRNCNFNELTDVWSFGVVIWECFARGTQPYGCQEFKEVMVHLKACDGMRLARPELCPKMLYEQLMLRCWEQKQPRRPTFAEIRTCLGEIFDSILAICPDEFSQNVIVKH